MYIAGTFTSPAITFGKISIQNTTSIKRAYLAKRSYRGEWLWAISPEGISTIVNIGLDKDGNIYTAGNFAGTVYFPTSISIKSYKFGVYVAKYSPDAACLWAKPAGSDAKTDSCKAAFTDENGNTYITGNFTGTFASGSLSATSAGGTDMFVSKITADAKWGFLSCAKGQQNETGVAITADADYAYVAGNFTSDKTTFDAQYTIQKNGNQDFFIAKYETSLGYYKGSTYSSGKAVTTAEALILNKGYLFVSGSYTGLSIVGGKELPEANSYNTFIGMLDVDLNWNWQNIGIGASTMNAHALTFNNKIVYVGGEYKKECVFGDVRLSATENYGVYSAAIDIDGKWLDALSSPYASASPRLVTMSTFGDSVTVAGDYSGGFQLGKTVLPETKYQMGYSASFSTLQPDPILVTGIVFDKTALSFTAPTLGSSTITATISPVTATNKNIYWSSSDNKVATAAGGVITAVGVGTCTITAAATDGSGKSATGTVTVSKEIILVNDIYLNRTILDKMVAGTSQQIFATILPSDASNQSITWKNSDDAVATVDNLGTITAKAAGSCTITAYTNDGSNLSASCNVTVIAENILISSISLDNSLSLLLSSGSYLLTPIISPTNASNQRLAWESSDLNIAEVDASGKITPKSAGECKISATAADGSAATATCVVTIVKEGVYATDISLSAYTMSLTIGAQQALVAALIPANATNEPLSWQSDNDKIATVGQSGNVTAIAAGTATVIVSLQNNPNIYAKCAVTVTDIAPIIDYSSLKKAIAEANAVRSSILPENIGSKPGQYTQATLTNFDNAIANAETAYGQLTTQVQINSATSTLVSAITKFRNSINGAVPVAGVAFNVTKLNLNVKSAAYQIVPTISPADASNKVLRWLSSNPAVASVDQSGSVTALQGGTATIYATSTDGTSKSTYCTVAVTVPVASIDIQQYLTIKINETATLTPLILPDDATNKNVVWRSQFPEIAAVSVTGAVTGKSAGSAKITVTSADGAYSSVCIVNVMSTNIAITALSFKDTAMTAIVGSALSVPVGISPYNATGSFTWKSSVPAVATVQSGGIVQALTVGTALITATSSADPLISDTLTLTVLPSAYPVAALIAPLKFTVGVSSIVLDLADFVRDDNTAAQDMLFDPNGTAQLAASISSSILTVTPEIGWTGKDSIAVYATDQDGQSVRFKIPFEISAAANTPPVISAIPHQTIQPGGMFMPLYLDKYVTDDFTRSSDI